MFLIFAFILIYFAKTGFTLSSQEMETTFDNDIIYRNADLENPLCELSRGQKDTFCRAVFQLPRFKVTFEAVFNRQAFFELEPLCSKRRLSFRALVVLNGWEQTILPCFGRHKTVRTSWHEDSYFDTFFVAFSRPNNIVYIFGTERQSEKEDIYIIDIFRLNTDPFSLPESAVTENEKTEEEFLSGIEAHTTNVRQVEIMYVRDMIRNEEHFEDPFESMGPEEILTVCLSIFTEIRYTSRGIFIDRLRMFTPPYEQFQASVYFLYENQRDGHPQKTYPCHALHESFTSVKSHSVKNRYSIASGRKPRSIFVFEMVGFSENVRPVDFIENFDFEHVLPSEPSEMDIYPNT